jgi:hypothetical protein
MQQTDRLESPLEVGEATESVEVSASGQMLFGIRNTDLDLSMYLVLPSLDARARRIPNLLPGDPGFGEFHSFFSPDATEFALSLAERGTSQTRERPA